MSDVCNDICNFNNNCLNVKHNELVCKICGASQDLEGKVEFANYNISEKVYIVNNGGGGFSQPSLEIIGVFTERTEALELLCEENSWFIEEFILNKIIYEYINDSKTFFNKKEI